MTTSETRFRFFLGGDRYLLGDDSTAIYLFERDRPDQPLQTWPNTIDGRIAAKIRLRELDDNIVALPGGPSAALVPRGQAANDDEDVVEAEIISNYLPRLRTRHGLPKVLDHLFSRCQRVAGDLHRVWVSPFMGRRCASVGT